MTPRMLGSLVGVAAGAVMLASVAAAHITPPVVLVSDRDAVVGLLAGAQKFFVREVRLSDAERTAIRTEWGWKPDEDFYRFYLGRDAEGRLVAAALFVTEFTVHGPVRVAVGLGPDGKVRGVAIVELTEETYPWVRPLVDQNLGLDYVGQGSRGRFGLSDRFAKAGLDTMPEFYAQVIASLIQRGAVLYDVGVLRRGAAG